MRSCLYVLLLERCFSNNQGTNQKYKKYLWWYYLWYPLLSSLLLLHVSCVFKSVVWKAIWNQSCFPIAFWTTSKHVPMQHQSNKRRQAHHITIYILEECLLLLNGDSLLRLPLCNCDFKPQVLATNATTRCPQMYHFGEHDSRGFRHLNVGTYLHSRYLLYYSIF